MSLRALLLSVPALCAIANASIQPVQLEEGYRQMYDMRFADAHETFRQYQAAHPDDAMGPVSDAAAYLFSEFDRLHILQSEFFTHDQHFVTDNKLTPDPALKQKFDTSIESARRMADARPNDNDALFAAVLSNGLQSDYSALIEKRYRTSFQQMK